MYTLIILYYHLTNCVATNWTGKLRRKFEINRLFLHFLACPAWSPPMTFVFVILLGLESFGFLIFTAVMTTIQFYCIYTDTTVRVLFWNYFFIRFSIRNYSRESNSLKENDDLLAHQCLFFARWKLFLDHVLGYNG